MKRLGGLPWLMFNVGFGPAVVGPNITRTFNDGQWHTVSSSTPVVLSVYMYVGASVMQSPPVCSNLCDGQGHVVLFEQASNTFYVTMDMVHMAAITATIVSLLTLKVYFGGFRSTSRRYSIATPYSMCLIPSLSLNGTSSQFVRFEGCSGDKCL